MDKILYMFAGLGMLFSFFFIIGLIAKRYGSKEPRNKYKHWVKHYSHINEKHFMKNYKWCHNGKHWFDVKEEYSCICYAR